MLNGNSINECIPLKADGCRKVGRPKLRWMNVFNVQGRRRSELDRRELKNLFGSNQGTNWATEPLIAVVIIYC
jgi:hypothetical protein